MGGKKPSPPGRSLGKGTKGNSCQLQRHDYDDIAKLIKEGIMIGGKKRHVELFKATPKKSIPSSHKLLITMGQMKEYIHRWNN